MTHTDILRGVNRHMTIACFALVLCFPKACGLVPGDDIYAAPPCIVDGAPVFMLHRSPPDSSPNAGAVSVTIDPEVLPTLDSVLHSLDSQFMALCGEDSDIACIEDLKRQTTTHIADVCGVGISCAANGGIAVTINSKALPYASPLDLVVPLAVDPVRFQTVASLLLEVEPQYEEVCSAQSFPSPEHWGPLNCSKEIVRQTVAWLRGNCNMHVGYPWQQAHGSDLEPGGRACDLAIVSAYVQVPGYSRRSREEYLQTALRVLPSLLTMSGKQLISRRACAVFFSDDEDFLNAVFNEFIRLRQIGINLGAVVTRRLASMPQEDLSNPANLLNSTVLSPVPSESLSRNARLSRGAIPHDINLKNGQELGFGVGRALAAGIWMQKFDLCAIAADLLPSTSEIHWHDLSSRTSTGELGFLHPSPGSLLATTYPQLRATSSLNFDGLAPCTAWATGWLLVMRRADAHMHAETFHSALKYLATEGHGYLDEEIVMAWASNAGDCRSSSMSSSSMEPPNMVIRDICSLSTLVCDSEGTSFSG